MQTLLGVIQAIAGAEIDPHFANAIIQNLTVAEVADLGRINAGRDSGSAPRIPEFLKPT